MGLRSVIGFPELLQLITTSKNYALTVLRTSHITIRHTRSCQSVTVFTSHCLVAAFNGRHSPSSVFPNCHWPQPPASTSNSSQWQNPSGYLIHLLQSQLCYNQQSVGQSVLVSSPHLGPKTRFLLLSDSCRCVDVGCPLWWEDGSIVYSCCCASPVRAFLGPSLSQIWDPLNLDGQVSAFTSPRNRVAHLYPQAPGSLSSPLMTRKAVVEVFKPTSTRAHWLLLTCPAYNIMAQTT
jgi:hypothetical protein